MTKSCIALLVLSLGVSSVACAASSDGQSEQEGSTSSNLLGAQPQFRMRQARRLLNIAGSKIDAASVKESLIVQAVNQVNAGIVWDNTHDSANEDVRDDSVVNVAVQDSINQCGDDANCLLAAAHLKLEGATQDKGGFRVAAMNTIDTAIATNN